MFGSLFFFNKPKVVEPAIPQDWVHVKVGQPKFCIDCKWNLGETDTSICKNPNLGINLVTGEIKRKFSEICRSFEDYCGEDAKWFELKNKQ